MDLHNIYNGKTVVVTGHTGFKGAWLIQLLHKWGAKIVGISLSPDSDSLYQAIKGDHYCVASYIQDINDLGAVKEIFATHQPDFVFHLAAQALVRPSYESPVDTFATNVMGTVHVLEAIRNLAKPCIGIMITTDKVYENNEQGIAFKENDKLGGYDPYSASKAACEIAISSYCNSFFNPKDYAAHQKAIVSLRAGNVIGGGDMAKDRILPDIVRAIDEDLPVKLRNPNAIRPWQHVLEPVWVYALMGAKLVNHPLEIIGSYNIGPEPSDAMKVMEVAEIFINAFGTGSIELDKGEHPHEANFLLLDNNKIKEKIGWIPALTGKEAVRWSAEWYAAPYSAIDKCNLQIDAFLEKVNK